MITPNAWRHLRQVSKSVSEEDKTGQQEVRESWSWKSWWWEASERCSWKSRRSSFWLLTDVRRNQNTACIRYCRADGWGRGKNAITVAIITQISLPLYLSPLFNTGINHHHIHYATSYHTQGRTKRTNIILSGRENNIVYRARTTIALFNK